jgi:antitoxin (DNA-binding transcriptional repressor) of toxin-antitoxin stability system
MRSVSISVTEASRNFADCINRVRYQGTSFLLHKNGVAVARIVPERKPLVEEELATEPAEPPALTEAAKPQGCTSAASPARPLRGIW